MAALPYRDVHACSSLRLLIRISENAAQAHIGYVEELRPHLSVRVSAFVVCVHHPLRNSVHVLNCVRETILNEVHYIEYLTLNALMSGFGTQRLVHLHQTQTELGRNRISSEQWSHDNYWMNT